MMIKKYFALGNRGSLALKLAVTAGLGLASASATAREFNVKINGRQAPWMTAVNAKRPVGIGDQRPPVMVMGANLVAGLNVTFHATGGVEWLAGGSLVGPAGEPGLVIERSMTWLPWHFIPDRSRPIGIGGLVGAFVDADGAVVGEPFGIGEETKVVVPRGAAAISLGINDDRFGDNTGSFVVKVIVPEPSVTVE